jgi:hypothetical protein
MLVLEPPGYMPRPWTVGVFLTFGGGIGRARLFYDSGRLID